MAQTTTRTATSRNASPESNAPDKLSEEEGASLFAFLDEKLGSVDAALARYLPPADLEPRAIHQCMSHAAAGGKRLRAILVLAATEILGGDASTALPTACAVELIHTHSLVLDDLPCMDGHSRRRHRPTCHKLFGESMALLAADALLNLAVAILARNHRDVGVDAAIALEIIKEVGEVVGLTGMIGAQLADLAGPGPAPNLTAIEWIEMGKTGALFRLSVRSGAYLASADDAQMSALSAYGEHLGLAFQIADDLLDLRSDRRSSRNGREPVNYALASGARQARRRMKELTSSALESLSIFGQRARPLQLLARYNATRER